MIPGIENLIDEMRELARKFEPVAMNGRVPERDDVYKLALVLHEVLTWIEHHDNRLRHATMNRSFGSGGPL